MECLRQTIHSDMLSGFLELPLSLRNTKVEIIVLPAQDKIARAPVLKYGSAFGCLKKYANPALIEQEKDAWERAVAERYASR